MSNQKSPDEEIEAFACFVFDDDDGEVVGVQIEWQNGNREIEMELDFEKGQLYCLMDDDDHEAECSYNLVPLAKTPTPKPLPDNSFGALIKWIRNEV